MKEREGIVFDESNIVDNPAQKTIAKLFLNSLYGKFGQIPNKVRMKIVDNLASFNAIARNPDYILMDLIALKRHNRMLLLYKHSEECVDENFRTNLVLASFVTMWARLRLFSLICTLREGGGEVLYFDTVNRSRALYLKKRKNKKCFL